MDTAGFRREWERRGGRVVVVQYRDSVSRELPITLARDGVTCFINRVNPDDAYDDFTSALFWATLECPPNLDGKSLLFNGSIDNLAPNGIPKSSFGRGISCPRPR